MHPLYWRQYGGCFSMAKYSQELKLKAIEMYNSGIGSATICSKLGVSERSTILRWVYLFDKFGFKGLTRPKGLPIYSASFKIKVITWLVRNNASFPETAKHFNISNEGTVWQWKRTFDVHGSSGLASRRKRATTMTDDKKKPTKDDKIKQLEKDNEYLKAENEYLKKLRAVMDQTRKKPK